MTYRDITLHEITSNISYSAVDLSLLEALLDKGIDNPLHIVVLQAGVVLHRRIAAALVIEEVVDRTCEVR